MDNKDIMIEHKKKFKWTLKIIEKGVKWEEYVEVELENGDGDLEEIYTEFYWGSGPCSYGAYLLNCIREAQTEFIEENLERLPFSLKLLLTFGSKNWLLN